MGNGDVTPQQLRIFRLLQCKGPIHPVQVILELCDGPVIAPQKRRQIENDLRVLEAGGFIHYDLLMRHWFVSSTRRKPNGA